MGMELGRPLAVSITQVICSLPADYSELENMSQTTSNRPSPFNAQFVKLILATRAIYITFYRKCADVLGLNGQPNLYQNAKGLEACAEFLQSKVNYLQIWLYQVPDSLKYPRKNLGQPFSTDRSMLNIELNSARSIFPLQSLFLELLYHNLAMSLFRPFISFSRVPGSSAPVTDSHAASCINHAIAITGILHQALTETILLTGWQESFQWQWNAVLSLIGYILTYPAGSLTTVARKAISTAITVFELLSENFSSAVSAANVTRDLAAKADLLVERSRASFDADIPHSSEFSSTWTHMPDSAPTDLTSMGSNHTSSPDIFPFLAQEEPSPFQNTLTNSSGFAFNVDSLLGLEDVGAENSMAFDFLDFGNIGDL